MGGPRGLAAFLFFLGLSSQVSAAQKVIIVSGTSSDYFDGLYAEEGHGSSAHYKRLGGANSGGWYDYLYRGTERQGTWVLGVNNENNFERTIAQYRAPARSAGVDVPPERGWQRVSDGSKDGGESGGDRPNIRVTGFQLDEEETAAGVYERGGGETKEGFVCRTGRGNYNSEKWSHTKWTEEWFCDKTKACEADLNVSAGCMPVIVVGASAGMDGVYTTKNPKDPFKQVDASNILFKD